MHGATPAHPGHTRPDGTLGSIAAELDKQLEWATCRVPLSLIESGAQDLEEVILRQLIMIARWRALAMRPLMVQLWHGSTTLKTSNPPLEAR